MTGRDCHWLSDESIHSTGDPTTFFSQHLSCLSSAPPNPIHGAADHPPPSIMVSNIVAPDGDSIDVDINVVNGMKQQQILFPRLANHQPCNSTSHSRFASDQRPDG